MTVDLWLRNPHLHFRDAIASGYSRFVYTRAQCTTARLDAVSWLRKNTMSADVKAELLLIGPQGAAHYDVWTSHREPKAVYPVWQPNRPLGELQDLMMSPIAEMDQKEFDTLPPGLRPNPAQQHMVVIDKLPAIIHGTTRKLVQDIRMLAASNPNCKLHLHGIQHFPTMFQFGFGSVDFDPTYPTMQAIRLFLPNGMILHDKNKPEWAAYEDWITMLGFQFRQVVRDKRVLTAFNIRSADWASRWFTDDLRIKMRYQPTFDDQMRPRADYRPSESTLRNGRRLITVARRSLLIMNENKQADFFLCDGCIYRTSCKFARANSVCTYQGAETVGLAETFGSRHADTIITGLSDLLKMQADRTERSIESEDDQGEVNPEVTKQINALFKNGVMLAKLLNPELNGKGVTVNVGVNGNAAVAVAASDPRQLVANAVAALERQGIPRNEITPDMIKLLLSPAQSQPAIEGAVVKDA
jgi:hypothetical protein